MRVSNTAIGLFLIIFALAVIIHTRTFPSLGNEYPGPSLFPRVLAVLFILAGIGLIIQGIKNREKILKFDTGAVNRAGWINILFVLGAVVCYIFLADAIGFLILSFVIMTVLVKWLRAKTSWSLVMSAGVTLAIYILFAKILLVPLPWGLWGW